jgi:hypothetical protein
MNNSNIQPFCVKRMTDIIEVYGEESHLIKVSEENVEKTLLKIANVKIKPDITVKTALCNLEKFLPEVRSAFELQLFNVWYKAFKTQNVDHTADIEPEGLSRANEEVYEVEEIVEEPVVTEKSESVVEEVAEEEIVEEPVAIEEPEFEVEEIVEEPVVTEESESVAEEVVEEEIIEEPVALEEPESEVEEPVVTEESESVVEEIVEEPVVTEESESVTEEVVEEEIIEEPVAIEEPESEVEEIVEELVVTEESESVTEEVVEEKIVEVPDLVEPEMKSVEEDEQQIVEKKPVITDQSFDQIDESEAIPKKHKRDWFDFLLDCSAAMTQFFIRIFFKIKRS